MLARWAAGIGRCCDHRLDPDLRVPGRNCYTLTRDGLLFAHFYTKVYDHILRPLMAPDRPNAPPELATALDTLDQLVAGQIASARLPTTA